MVALNLFVICLFTERFLFAAAHCNAARAHMCFYVRVFQFLYVPVPDTFLYLYFWPEKAQISTHHVYCKRRFALYALQFLEEPLNEAART